MCKVYLNLKKLQHATHTLKRIYDAPQKTHIGNIGEVVVKWQT